MASVTITLLVKRGNAAGLRFQNSEWQSLLQEESLKTGFSFLTVDYDDVRTLSDGLDKKVKRCPYIDFRSGEKDVAYPMGKLLLASHIAAFALDFQKQVGETVVAARDAPAEKPIDTVPPSSWRLPLMIVGGAGAALIAIFAVVLLWDYRKRGKEDAVTMDDPAFLVLRDGEDSPVDFTRVNFKGDQDL